LLSDRPLRLKDPQLAGLTRAILHEFGMEAAWQNQSK
jgi:hypothetical protein